MEILELVNSPKSTKRFRVLILMDGKAKAFDFGSPSGYTYIDGASEKVRENFRKRHLANPTERQRIEGYIPSASLFAYRILWGDSQDICENLINLNKRLMSA